MAIDEIEIPLERLTLLPLNTFAAAPGRHDRRDKGWIPSRAHSAFVGRAHPAFKSEFALLLAPSFLVNFRKCGTQWRWAGESEWNVPCFCRAE
jgi:hypothetical protein